MSALSPRQFTPEQVEQHVPGAFAMGDVKPDDRFEKRLIPLESVMAGGQHILDINPEDVHEDGRSRRKVVKYAKQMREGKAKDFPPVIVADNGNGTHEFLDGHHRMHAATAAGIRHGVAYVRTNRLGWGAD